MKARTGSEIFKVEINEHARLDALSTRIAKHYLDTKIPGFRSVTIQVTDSTRDLGIIVIQGSQPEKRVEIKDARLCCAYHLMEDIETYTLSRIIEGFLEMLDKENDN